MTKIEEERTSHYNGYKDVQARVCMFSFEEGNELGENIVLLFASKITG